MQMYRSSDIIAWLPYEEVLVDMKITCYYYANFPIALLQPGNETKSSNQTEKTFIENVKKKKYHHISTGFTQG